MKSFEVHQNNAIKRKIQHNRNANEMLVMSIQVQSRNVRVPFS